MSFWDQVVATTETLADKAKEGATKAKAAADVQLEKAKQSEAWAKTKEVAADIGKKTNAQLEKAKESEAWARTKEVAADAGVQVAAAGAVVGAAAVAGGNQLQEKFVGTAVTVTFGDPKLGMTLSRDRKGRPVVSRVDEGGAAEALKVAPGDVVVSMRAGFPGDGGDEPTIKVQSYDHLMGLFPAMGRPVTIVFLKPRNEGEVNTAGVVNFKMEDELEKATGIVSKLTTERALNPDALVPQEILKRARGLAFIRVAKIGFGLSVKVGTGIVVARLGEALDSWSAPCAIGTAGVGMGFQWGAELTDFMLVLNTQEAVEAFASGNQVCHLVDTNGGVSLTVVSRPLLCQVSLGGNVGIAVGPVGRNAGVSGNIHGGELATGDAAGGKVGIAPCYAYSHSKGLFLGISLEGAVIKPRKDVNLKFYGSEVTAKEILSGMTLPPAAAEPLYEVLAAGLAGDDDASGGGGLGASGGVQESPVMGQPFAEAAAPTGGAVASAATVSAANPFTDAAESTAESNPKVSGDEAPNVDEGTGEIDTGDAASAVEI